MHETIRCTPAMAIGVANHPWTVAELIQVALAAKPMPPVYTPAGAAAGTLGRERQEGGGPENIGRAHSPGAVPAVGEGTPSMNATIASHLKIKRALRPS